MAGMESILGLFEGMGEAVLPGHGGSGPGVAVAVCRGNRPVGGAGGGLEEQTVQIKGFYCRTE